ncbi:hypothetical protein C8R44DRAFT_875400 [Mycena epipterygia]|nr:hypothetical protein C8R44DRAFT_875400 [Mycena epipterygia]
MGLTSDLAPLLPGLRGRLPSLRRLWAIAESQAGPLESVDCSESASSLVDAGFLNELRYVPTLLPSHQLTHYNLDAPWEIHKGVLTAASKLVQAHIHASFNDETLPYPGEIIDLLHLERLFLSHERILTYLRTPLLQDIGFAVDQEEDLDYHPCLEPFVARSRYTLRKLSFNGMPTPHAANEILRQNPSILELVLVVPTSQSADNLISHLSISDSAGILTISRQLSQISLWSSDHSGLDYTIYLHMLQSRWEAEDCDLKGATLLATSGKGPDLATLRDLDALRQNGMYFFDTAGKGGAS